MGDPLSMAIYRFQDLLIKLLKHQLKTENLLPFLRSQLYFAIFKYESDQSSEHTQKHMNINWKLISNENHPVPNDPEHRRLLLNANKIYAFRQLIEYLPPPSRFMIVYTENYEMCRFLYFSQYLWAWFNIKSLNLPSSQKMNKMGWNYGKKKMKNYGKLTVKHVNRHRDFCKIANCTCIVAGIVPIRIRYI